MIELREASPGDLPAIKDLLLRSGLPADDIDTGRVRFILGVLKDKIVGVAGLETYPPLGLLRSAAVEPDSRGSGIGGLLVGELIARTKKEGLSGMVLLTESAEGFFRGRGFRMIDRRSLSGPILLSSQFTGSRCSSAVAMMMRYGRTDDSPSAEEVAGP